MALQRSIRLLDLIDANKAKAAKREAALLDVIAGLTARVDALEQADRTHEIKASRELAEQQARLSEAVIAASGVEASLRNQTVASQVEHDRQGVESRAALEAQATAIDALKGSVKSTTQLMAERSNAIQDQLAQVAPQVQKLAVQQVELNDGIAADRRHCARSVGQAVSWLPVHGCARPLPRPRKPGVKQHGPKPCQVFLHCQQDPLLRWIHLVAGFEGVADYLLERVESGSPEGA